jgi:hypothetical protein
VKKEAEIYQRSEEGSRNIPKYRDLLIEIQHMWNFKSEVVSLPIIKLLVLLEAYLDNFKSI